MVDSLLWLYTFLAFVFEVPKKRILTSFVDLINFFKPSAFYLLCLMNFPLIFLLIHSNLSKLKNHLIKN